MGQVECCILLRLFVIQGVIGLAIERYRLMQLTSLPTVEPLAVLAPLAIVPWYDLINSDLIPLSSYVRFLIPFILLHVPFLFSFCSSSLNF
jgi:hypothetical protein